MVAIFSLLGMLQEGPIPATSGGAGVMSSYLRQSTAAQVRSMGPFIDNVDFITDENALTINASDVKLIKNGSAAVNKNSGGGTARGTGEYGLTFNAADTDIVGELTVVILVAGALLVRKTFWVLEETVYDALFGASAAFVEIADAILDRPDGIETGYSLKSAQRVQLAAASGKSLDNESLAPKFRDPADTKNRISADTDEDGNRNSVTLDVS